MVDKLVLTTREYAIKDIPSTGMRLQGGTIDFDTGESNDVPFRDSKGNEYKGSKLYVNEKIGDENYYGLDINAYGLRLTLNPSKLNHPFELLQDMDTLKNTTNEILDDVAKKGINFSCDDLRMSRADLAKNRIMEMPIPMYSDTFSSLKMSRASGKKMSVNYPSGYMTGNNQLTSIFYDKLAEHVLGQNKKGGGNQIFLTPDKHILRGELQALKPDSVNRVFKLGTLSDLYRCDMDYLEQCYSDTMNDKVFKHKINNPEQAVIFEYEAIRDELIKFKESRKNGVFKQLMSLFPSDIPEHYISMLLKDCNYDRTTIWRISKQHREQMQKRAMLFKGLEKKAIESQYREIYTKFISKSA